MSAPLPHQHGPNVTLLQSASGSSAPTRGMVGHTHRQSSFNGSGTSISVTSICKVFSRSQVLVPLARDQQWNQVLQPVDQSDSSFQHSSNVREGASFVQCNIEQSVPAHQHSPNIEQCVPAHKHSPNIEQCVPAHQHSPNIEQCVPAHQHSPNIEQCVPAHQHSPNIEQCVPAHQHSPNIEQCVPAHQHSPNIELCVPAHQHSPIIGSNQTPLPEYFISNSHIRMFNSDSNGLPSCSVIDDQATSENMVILDDAIHEIYRPQQVHASLSEMNAMRQGGNRRTTMASSAHSTRLPPIEIFHESASYARQNLDSPNFPKTAFIEISENGMMKEEPGSNVNYSNQESFNCGTQFASVPVLSFSSAQQILNGADHEMITHEQGYEVNNLQISAGMNRNINLNTNEDQRDDIQVNQPAGYSPVNYLYAVQPSGSGNEYSTRAVEDSKQSGEFQQPANSVTSHSLNCGQKSNKRQRTEQHHDSLENNSKYQHGVPDSHTRKKKPSNSKKEKKPPSEIKENLKNPKCGHCFAASNSSSELRDHIKTTICGKLYSENNPEVNNENRVYTCDAHNCKFASLSHVAMGNHTYEHRKKNESLSGSKPNGKRSQASTTNHNSRIRHSPEVIKCDLCGYQCAFEKTFFKHIDKHVNNEVIVHFFNCFMCDEDHETQADATNCEKSHMKNGKYECPFCDGFCSQQRKKMIQHMRAHFGERCHKCPVCDYAVNRKDNLMTHGNHNHPGAMIGNVNFYCPRVKLYFRYQNICIKRNVFAKLNLRGKVVVVQNDLDIIRCLFEEAGMSESEFLESNPHYRPRTNAPHEVLARNENLVSTSAVYGLL